jgi:hypothetical protein
MPKIFIAQTCVDRWLAAGGLSVESDLMRLRAMPQVPFYIGPAVYFERIDGAEADPYDIVGAVKTSQELSQIGADHYDTSVVLGEFAYTVRPGFLAIPLSPDGTEAVLDGVGWGAMLRIMESLGTQ